MLDALGSVLSLGLGQGTSQGSFVADGSGRVASDGPEQLVADPELQGVGADEDVAAFAGAVRPDRDLLPGHADHAVGRDFAGDPVRAGAIG
ncbi:MAG: hypothetical protein HGA51_08760, partial [Demequinaceae bacterium]|nr:hypothetical protein [Demequinaceae bacterium]